ncbi:MAG TPA: ABC transporter permease, partial [Gaiellaceae bacterium]
DDSIPSRYVRWLGGLVTGGDAGHTVVEDTPIWPPVWISLKHTLQLLAATLVVVALFSLGIGVVSAARPGSVLDVSMRGFGYLAWSVPVFLLALVLQQAVFRAEGSWGFQPLPPNGLPSGHGLAYVGDWFRHMVLPVATLAAAYIGAHSRYVRSAMLDSLRAPYAVVARSKGLTERRVLVRHALRNSLIPFITVLALDFGALFGGSFVVDWIFHLQGLGALWVNAVAGYDPFQIEAVLVVTAAAVVVFSVLSDAALGLLDPRVRLD